MCFMRFHLLVPLLSCVASKTHGHTSFYLRKALITRAFWEYWGSRKQRRMYSPEWVKESHLSLWKLKCCWKQSLKWEEYSNIIHDMACVWAIYLSKHVFFVIYILYIYILQKSAWIRLSIKARNKSIVTAWTI